MRDLKVKIKRQTEILGLVLADPGKYKFFDFEEMFKVNDLTIKRDFQELRALAIDIHSEGKRGINLSSKIPTKVLKELIPQYIGIAVQKSSYDKATNLLINKLGQESLAIITRLQISIENKKLVKLIYLKAEDNIVEERAVEPYCIFQGEKQWRLLAGHKGIIKQFLLSNIKQIEILERSFKGISQEQIDEIFSTSFKCWLGTEKYSVKLKFTPPWPERIKPRQLMEFQKITEESDGSIIYETVVNSLNEIASWIVSRGRGVIVLEPEALRINVISIAKGVLDNY